MEPERRIEKLLRAFAKKRREQAGEPMELHPVARQQLQKEAARRSAGTSRSGWFSSFFLGLKPGLAFTFAFCVIALVVIGFIFTPNSNGPKPPTLASLDLSRDKMIPAQKTIPAASPPPVITEGPLIAGEGTHVFDDKQQINSGVVAVNPVQPQLSGANVQLIAPPAETRNLADALKTPASQPGTPAGAAVASTAPSSKETYAFKSDGAAVADSFGGTSAAGTLALNKDAANQPSAPPLQRGTVNVTNGITLAANEDARKKLAPESVAPVTASAAYFERSKNEVAATTPPVSKVFNRLYTFNGNRRTADTLIDSSAVLLSFRVEQTGNALRVFDADGSVYTGAVEVAQEESVARAGAPKTVVPAGQFAKTAASARQPIQNYFFRVAGTNRNLKENVVFSGNLIPLTNTALFMDRGGIGGGGGATAQGALSAPVESLISNARISGKAVIGTQQEIEVNATPAP